tara:strand:+ start:225 stop:434 length:210 start_codon:yes stop_codon:yes gene_type:complete
MTMLVHYKTKKLLKSSIGQRLVFTETSIFGKEYKPNGVITVAHRPHLTGSGREFFARVTMKDDKIVKVQ